MNEFAIKIRAWEVLAVVGILLAGCAPSSTDTPPAGQGAGSPAAEIASPEAQPTEQAAAPKKAELLLELPLDYCNTPDGMALLADGNIVLSMPNFNDATQPPLLVKITPDNKVEKLFDLPPNPETGKPFGPLGVCVDPSGDLLLADIHGVLSIPKDVARDLPRVANDIARRERKIVDLCRFPGFSIETLRAAIKRMEE